MIDCTDQLGIGVTRPEGRRSAGPSKRPMQAHGFGAQWRGPWFLAFCLGVFAWTGVALAQRDDREERSQPSSLEALLAGFSELEGLEAQYEEERHISLLSEPVESSGTLFFLPPSALLKRVVTPEASDILIRPGRIRVSRGEQVETIDLEQRPEAAPLVEGVLWIFSGDREAVEGAFTTEFERGAERWTLRLVPRAAPLNQLIAEMEIQGNGFHVEVIEVRETSGDRTVTRVVEADPARRFSEAERAQLFEPSGS